MAEHGMERLDWRRRLGRRGVLRAGGAIAGAAALLIDADGGSLGANGAGNGPAR